MLIPLSPEILLRAYAAGIFPMAESADDPELFWVDPKRRGIIPLARKDINARALLVAIHTRAGCPGCPLSRA